MSNVIQIKHGPVNNEGVMPSGKLAPYELGYASDGFLYIGGELKGESYGEANTIKVHHAAYAAQAGQLTEILPVSRGGTGLDTSGLSIPQDSLIVFNTAKNTFGYIKNDEGTIYYDGNKSLIKGTLPIAYGGTGATTAANARAKLGLGAVATMSNIPIDNGGTGTTTIQGIRNLLYAGSSSVTVGNSDSTSYWGGQGAITVNYISNIKDETLFPNRPNGYGLLTTFSNGDSEVFQLWSTQSGGDIYHRQGNGSGNWGHSWRRFLDEINCSSYVLPLSGGTLSGTLNLVSNKYYSEGHIPGINCNNSDIINLNGLYFCDIADGAGEGINFNQVNSSTTGPWDTLYAKEGKLYFHAGRAHTTVLGGSEILHKGIMAEQKAYKGVSGTTPGTFTFSRQYSFYLVVNYHLVSEVYNPMLVPRVAGTRTYHIRTAGGYERTFKVGFSGNNVTVTNVSPASSEYFEVWGVF